MQTMSPQYKVAVKVGDLREGFEFQPNRFIYKKVKAGCYVSYKSQDGTVKQLKDPDKQSLNLWLSASQYVDCVVDFVPVSLYDTWEELNKLGKCRLEYDPFMEVWSVVFLYHPCLANILRQNEKTQNEAILRAYQDLKNEHLVFNGHRYFLVDDDGVRKISDQEAEKLKESE